MQVYLVEAALFPLIYVVYIAVVIVLSFVRVSLILAQALVHGRSLGTRLV